MYIEHKHFKLPNNTSEVDVFISPTGDIEVMIEGNQQVLKGDFHHLSFKIINTGVDLIYKTRSKKSSWDIILTQQDAETVSKMMNEADEYYEIIMRDL
ncbi:MULTISPECIES: hypothetical protein [unclassified Photobacterium]|uniref:hypothetical protein n=1 Tax=unclassified Photobacterium TaxID=2628852 RepID=UPI000D1690E1|nr:MULTISPECIES: hypothetical protein [unclassified Photobacterium]PSV26969.1 hypothetical protein C9J42_08865 [Photobacterium sp. GB-56]PSV34155.1 hypothetical protein C9J44_16565 [Photobacterium sp. GB-27]PSV37395.1 hypothetical protein C9J38_11555 [Photobacterium sp. GB-210]PSV42501.1 hypothetical protein C9J46_14340 [Photobacterium sp. GB-36]PSV54196.1 hypothetical protein C9J45_05385 [Photobacterium sp. GB-1]